MIELKIVVCVTGKWVCVSVSVSARAQEWTSENDGRERERGRGTMNSCSCTHMCMVCGVYTIVDINNNEQLLARWLLHVAHMCALLCFVYVCMGLCTKQLRDDFNYLNEVNAIHGILSVCASICEVCTVFQCSDGNTNLCFTTNSEVNSLFVLRISDHYLVCECWTIELEIFNCKNSNEISLTEIANDFFTFYFAWKKLPTIRFFQ